MVAKQSEPAGKPAGHRARDTTNCIDRKRGDAMKRAFFAIVLLAVSWLPAIGYFHHPDAFASFAFILVGVLLLIGTSHWEIDRAQGNDRGNPVRRRGDLDAWPYRTIPLLRHLD